MTTTAVQQTPLTADLVRRLAAPLPAGHGPCATIFLPPYRPGVAASPKTVMRAMTQRIGQQLRDRGMRALAIENFLRPLVDLAAQPEFEQGHDDAWAIFRSPSDVYFARAAANWPETGAVGDCFYLLPALEWLATPHTALLLAVTNKSVRLYRLREGVLVSVALPEAVPAAFDLERVRNAAEHAANRSGAVHFGVADVADRAPRMLRDYFAEVARGLEPLFERERVPVILAGTKETLTLFRDVARSEYLLAEGLTLSPDGGYPLPELEQRMVAILASTPQPAEARAAGRIRAEGRRKWLTEEKAAWKAAAEGRVAALFVAAGRSLAESELANRAAVETLGHGGDVWVVPAARVPAGAGLIAELRFSR